MGKPILQIRLSVHGRKVVNQLDVVISLYVIEGVLHDALDHGGIMYAERVEVCAQVLRPASEREKHHRKNWVQFFCSNLVCVRGVRMFKVYTYRSRLHVTNFVVDKQSGQRLPESVLKKQKKGEMCVCVCVCVHGRESGKGACRIVLQESGRSKYYIFYRSITP